MAPAKVIVRVLGSVDVVDADGEVHAIPGRRAQRLLCRLMCDGERIVSVDALVDAVWADGATSGPVAALQTQVFRLRKLLAFPGAPTIVTTPTGYRLELGEATTDALEFERAVDSAATAEPAAAADALEAALELWRGPAFAGAEDVESLRSEQIRLDELHCPGGRVARRGAGRDRTGEPGDRPARAVRGRVAAAAAGVRHPHEGAGGRRSRRRRGARVPGAPAPTRGGAGPGTLAGASTAGSVDRARRAGGR